MLLNYRLNFSISPDWNVFYINQIFIKISFFYFNSISSDTGYWNTEFLMKNLRYAKTYADSLFK